jgi:RND superfamily putative drug exporter
VQRRPLVVLVLTLTGLAVLAAPLLSARLTNPDLDGIPRTLESKRVADTLDARFARHGEPAIVVVARTDPATLDAWAARHADDRGVTEVEPAEAVAPGLSTVDIHVAGDPRGGQARALVETFRADRPDGGQSWVSGTAAFFTDQLALLRRDLPWALAVMVAAMLVLLFAMTGSVVVPVKALAMNLVSMGATFGVMVAAFQWGWGADPLDLLVNAGLDPFVLVIVFAFAFGLSMDYETFLLARIKEAYDSGSPNDEAVRIGLQRSGRIITSAAVAMVIVFGAFGGGQIGTVEQIGLGLVVAVLVDATIVRCLLVPATMTLLGRANWWAPRPLRALHSRFGLREAPAPSASPERELTSVG